MKLVRTIGAIAFCYALVLVATGGFDVSIGPVALRSHDIDRFVALALLAGLADAFSRERPRQFLARLWRPGTGPVVPALPRRTPRPWALAVGASALIVATAALWLLARVIRGHAAEAPIGDMALLELYTIDATRNALLVGPYSRFGWHHPGPAMFYLFKPLYELSGAQYESLRWSALVFNVACVAMLLALVARRARPTLAVALTAGLGLYLLRVPDLLASPWNPHLLVLPLGLLLAACAALLAGDLRFGPAVAVLGSWLVQTHLSATPTVVAVVGSTLLWRRAYPGEDTSPDRRRFWTGVSVAALAAMWILPLAEQFTATDGNLGVIYRSFRAPLAGPSMREGVAGASSALASSVLPNWSLAWGAHVVRTVSVAGLAIAIAPLLAAPWTAGRLDAARDHVGAALTALGLVATLAALWSASHIQGDIFDQLVFWISIIGILNISCLVSAGLLWIVSRFEPRFVFRPAVVTALVWIVLVGSSANGVRELYRAHRLSFDEPVAQRVRAESQTVHDYLAGQGFRRPLVRMGKSTWGDAAGVVLSLQKSGLAVSVEPAWIFMYGRTHTPTGEEDCELVFADRSETFDTRYELVAERPELSIRATRLTPRSAAGN